MATIKKDNETKSKLIDLFVSGGLIEDKSISDKKIREARQQRQKKAYHNTELLLKQYRNLSWMLENFPETIAEELERPFENVDEMINRLDVDMAYGNKRLESRMQAIEKTRLIIDRVNEALTILKKKPNDGERLYELISLTYIEAEVLTHNDLLFRLNVSSRHYYRLREQAINVLSLRLWSTTDKDMDMWLDVMSIFENGEVND